MIAHSRAIIFLPLQAKILHLFRGGAKNRSGCN